MLHALLCFCSFLLEDKALGFVFFWSVEKPERFTPFFGMFTMMDVMSMNHSLQISASLFRPPSYSLMNNYIMKDKIEKTIQKDTQAHREHIGIVGDKRKIIKDGDGGNTKYNTKEVILLKSMLVHGMM